MSPLMRVPAPIKVSIFKALFCFRLNICSTLGLGHTAERAAGHARGLACARCLSFRRETLGFPDERLPKSVSCVSARVNFDSDAGRFESWRQLYRFIVVLEVAERVREASPMGRRHL